MAAVAADRELLFGLLALQNGLINQAQLLAAFQAWTLERSKGLADHLVALGHLAPTRRPVVEAMAALHLEAHGGDVEKSLAAVPANRSTHASLAALGEPEIEATLARVSQGRNLGATQAEDDADRTASLSVGEATSDGQRFRILRPHARGGLGAVFVALDSELNREVALKQILEKHADDPVSRHRFVAEAEITGGLEHPGVVPVYGLGTYSSGRPYYAMRFIRGDSLKEAVEHFHADDSLKNNPGRRSLELRKLLRRFTDVCNAVDYAHSRGVIHRDLKPANIILGKHGETLVVDWGLAKAVGRADPSSGEQLLTPSSSGSSETLPGSALGTPAYMSPEQASGDLDRLGPRSDVYSLGATLYCLLTGKPCFEDQDVGEVLRKVQRGAFAHPRRLDPKLDRALEAVCLKAMALEAGDRYPSCRALAEDVERWMADESVSAWAEPWTRKLVRWLTRHRTEVTGAAAAVLAGVVGLTSVLAVQTQANAQLSASLTREMAASRALAVSNDELTRAKAAVQARFELAQKAIATFHTGVSEDMLLKNDQFKELRTKLLKEAAEFYADMENLLVGQTDARSRKALAEGNFQLAELTDKIGSKPDALAVHRKALEIRRALATDSGADVETRLDVVRSLSRVGYQLFQIGDEAGALATYEEDRKQAEQLEAENPTEAVRTVLAQSYNSIGWSLYRTGKPAKALEALHKSLNIRKRLVDANPAVIQLQVDLSNTHNNIGHVLRDTGRPAEALEAHREAIAIVQKLADANPTVAKIQMQVAGTYNNIGLMLSQTGHPAGALEAQRKALVIRQRLADANPAVTQLEVDLAWCHGHIGHLLVQTGNPEDALEAYRKALAVWQKLADANPADPEVKDDVARSYNNIGRLHARQKRFAEAFTALDTGLAIRQKLIDSDPKSPRLAGYLGSSYAYRGEARVRAGQSAGAAADLRRAVELWANAPHLDTDSRFERAMTLVLLTGLGKDPKSDVTAAAAAKFADQAVAALREAIEAGWAQLDELKEPEFDPIRDRTDFHNLEADLQAKLGPKAGQEDGSSRTAADPSTKGR